MASFYFSRVPKFKIKSGKVVSEQGDNSSQPPVLLTATVPEVVVPHASKAIAGISSTVLSAPRIIAGVSPVIPPKESSFSSKDSRRSDKRKMVTDEEEETAMPRKGSEGNRDARNSREAK
ncbi:hypothetical protein Fot_05329 [Forsythia ovata]|uniref:Uncharacterized protein n=1 Tax=Forsythia ovata TaxID=205694 RepID=A0ABD1WQF9_9LAMI